MISNTDEVEQRQRVVDVARSWVGTPYHHRANIKGVGTDCGMILIEVFTEAGIISHFDPGKYSPDWMLHRDAEVYLSIVERFAAPTVTPGPGDLVLFRFGRCISHSGIITTGTEIVHAYKDAGGVVLDDIARNGRLAQRIAGYWSVWGN